MYDKYQKINEFDFFLEGLVVKLIQDTDVLAFLKNSKELLSQYPLRENIVLLWGTYKIVYERYYQGLSKGEVGLLEKGICDLEFTLGNMESQRTNKSNLSH